MNIKSNLHFTHPHQEKVILLHGIGRTSRSMRRLEAALQNSGYETLNMDYPSRKKPINALSTNIFHQITSFVNQPNLKIHFVAHSMGGLVIHDLLKNHEINNLGKIVLLSPPIQGSEIADFLQHNILYRWFYGPAGLELTTTASKNQPRNAFPTDVGVIAGDQSLSFFGHLILPKHHDGRVSVASTRFAQMKDHLVLPVDHTFMMNHPTVITQVLYFLRLGHFKK